MPTQAVEFLGALNNKLSARLDLPQGKAMAYALFAHCFTCSKDILAASKISQALAEQGIAVLRFDFTGLGSSEGEFANTNFSSNVQDLIKACEFLEAHHQAPSLLVGHSLGGAAVLAAAANLPSVKAVCTIAAPSDPAHVTHLFGDAIPAIKAQGELAVQLAGRKFTIQKQFLEDVAEQRLLETVGKLRQALLIFHSPADELVSVDHARKIYEAAKHPKSYVSLANANHLLTNKADAVYVANVLSAWASRYLGQAETAIEATAVPEGSVLVEESDNGFLMQNIAVGKHRLIADEPASFGGDDQGPSPYEYLLAALGACTAMTLRMYAKHKSLPLDKVSVTLKHEKIHAEDCQDCESETGKIDQIERTIKIEGDLDEAQLKRLLYIADRCPVHKTLHSEVSIPTKLDK